MSYGFTTDAVAKSGVGDAIRTAYDGITVGESVTAEVTEHVNAAVDAVALLVDAVGRSEDHVSVTVAGHANPGHAPTVGWADDQITVTVRQVVAAEQEAPA